MSEYDTHWLHVWDAIDKIGFLVVILGVAIEGVEHYKHFKRGESKRRKLIEKFGWFLVVAGLAMEFIGIHYAKRITDKEYARMQYEASTLANDNKTLELELINARAKLFSIDPYNQIVTDVKATVTFEIWETNSFIKEISNAAPSLLILADGRRNVGHSLAFSSFLTKYYSTLAKFAALKSSQTEMLYGNRSILTLVSNRGFTTLKEIQIVNMDCSFYPTGGRYSLQNEIKPTLGDVLTNLQVVTLHMGFLSTNTVIEQGRVELIVNGYPLEFVFHKQTNSYKRDAYPIPHLNYVAVATNRNPTWTRLDIQQQADALRGSSILSQPKQTNITSLDKFQTGGDNANAATVAPPSTNVQER